MKTQPIVPARIEWRADGVPFSPLYGDVYHPLAGAEAQAEHVFLGGNGLPDRWRDRERFVILETGFGLGHNFLATLAAWRADPRRCRRLCFISIEKHPPTRDTLHAIHGDIDLVRAWPPLTPNLHTLAFGAATLLLALGDAAGLLPNLVAEVDAFYLDGFAPSKNPQMWDRRLLKAVGRLAAPQASAATWSVAREVRDGLASAGFVVERVGGFGSKRETTAARFAPAFVPRRAPSRWQAPAGRDVIVIGAGLVGAATAQALVAHGFDCTVLDRQPAPALETSGNPGGLFHGIFNAQDGRHARFNRAAALRAAQVYEPLIARGIVPGRAAGLLRLEAAADVQAMRRRIAELGLPADFIEALDAPDAARRAALPLALPAWHYPRGGWLDPRALVRHWLGDTPSLRFCGESPVHALRRDGDRWQALDAGGAVMADAATVVLANAADVMRLLGAPAWPLQTVRGQMSLLRGAPPPALPVAGAGYAIGLPGGEVLCGATSQPNDPHAQPRAEDDAANLAQFARLAGVSPAQLAITGSRVGWRVVSDDRLPVIGPVPLAATPGTRLDQPRLVPREPGLFVCTALGSRGITWAPLLGETLAAWIAGAPLPLEADLVDAIDVARFVSRQARHSVQPPPSDR